MLTSDMESKRNCSIALFLGMVMYDNDFETKEN